MLLKTYSQLKKKDRYLIPLGFLRNNEYLKYSSRVTGRLRREQREYVKRLRPYLTKREYRIFKMRFHDGATFEETGKEFNLTMERVRQIECKILDKISELAKPI